MGLVWFVHYLLCFVSGLKENVILALQLHMILKCLVLIFPASAVSGTFQQNQVHTPSSDCPDHLHQERGRGCTQNGPMGVMRWQLPRALKNVLLLTTSGEEVCANDNSLYQTSSVGEAQKLVVQAADLLSAIQSSIQHGIQSQNDTTKGGNVHTLRNSQTGFSIQVFECTLLVPMQYMLYS